MLTQDGTAAFQLEMNDKVDYLSIDADSEAVQVTFDQGGKIKVQLKEAYQCSFTGKVIITVTATQGIERC